MGADWSSIVQLWWQLEKASGFSTQTKTHATTGRPKCVGIWVKNARKGTPTIEGGVEGMERDWWAWWRRINPDWRLRGDELLRLDGDWGVLKCPGQNGFLNVIICLKWWRAAMEGPSEAWERAIADLKWALECMVG
ncbi:hypothetical protein GGX14DRAFT_376999 [Mycena pura]|uniref:Uncharacterized protein n=1 Tax=Mycena pura TaxID=153505 RepID=A0AAD6V2C4_9AGAR|nr:hypothetical protein GGX14DRAFT_376999 [Mycena pura]